MPPELVRAAAIESALRELLRVVVESDDKDEMRRAIEHARIALDPRVEWREEWRVVESADLPGTAAHAARLAAECTARGLALAGDETRASAEETQR